MINLIMARDEKYGIGFKGKLPWKQAHFKEDMRVFKNVTMGDIVVMGTKTWESLPESVKPLPGRTNIVFGRTNSRSEDLSTNPIYMQEVYQITHFAEEENCWVIGGAKTYAQFMPFTSYIMETVIEDEFEADIHVEPVPFYFTPIFTIEYFNSIAVKVKHILHRNGLQPGNSRFEKSVKHKVIEALEGARHTLTERDTFTRAKAK